MVVAIDDWACTRRPPGLAFRAIAQPGRHRPMRSDPRRGRKKDGPALRKLAHDPKLIVNPPRTLTRLANASSGSHANTTRC